MTTLQAPFPWFGGKSRVADVVWRHLGKVVNYVEPFAGSLAVLLGRPAPFDGVETVNDLDGLVCNFWRAVARDPEGVAYHADNPVNENDLHARHSWLVREALPDLPAKLEGDPDWHDAKIAGWWCWGLACWIGSEFCSGKGPWKSVEMEDGIRRLVKVDAAGQGVNRQLVHLGDLGRGVNRQRVHLGNLGQGVNRTASPGLVDWMQALADRLRHVRVCCGDWSRVCGPSPTVKLGTTAVFLDPPYASDLRDQNIYRSESVTVARDVYAWCAENGNNKLLRIALCGYDGEHNELGSRGWTCFEWKTAGGYGSQGSQGSHNAHLERIWFSPHCLRERTLFDD